MCDYTVTYKDFDNDTDYTEYVFPMHTRMLPTVHLPVISTPQAT